MADIYRFRLEAEDGEFREGAIAADSKEEAKQTLEAREYGFAAFRLSTQELAEAKDSPNTAASRSRLALHNQAKPYKLVKLEKQGG